jgi:hypothetical protein
VKAQRIEDNSPEGRRRREQAEAEAHALAELQSREAEIEAMGPEERIAARLVDDAGGAIYRPAYEALVKLAEANGGRLEGLEPANRSAKVLRNARAALLHRLDEEEARRAGIVGRAPTGRMSKPVPKSLIRDVVRARYPKQTKNLERWWKQYVEKPGIVVDEVNYRAFRIDVGQLLATLPKLTEADIAPLLP